MSLLSVVEEDHKAFYWTQRFCSSRDINSGFFGGLEWPGQCRQYRQPCDKSKKRGILNSLRVLPSLSGEVNYRRLIGEVDSLPLVITAQSLEALSRWAPWAHILISVIQLDSSLKASQHW